MLEVLVKFPSSLDTNSKNSFAGFTPSIPIVFATYLFIASICSGVFVRGLFPSKVTATSVKGVILILLLVPSIYVTDCIIRLSTSTSFCNISSLYLLKVKSALILPL